MTMKQSFQLENILCGLFHDILKRFLEIDCLDASFTCLFRYVAFRVLFERFMLLNAKLWFTVTQTFQSNEPKFAEWSK